jgi:DNA invertase Pin-like site-specific DNA recombinase
LRKAIAYLRRSTRAQEISFDVQLMEISAFAERCGYEIVETLRDSSTGRSNERKGFTSAIDMLQSDPELHLLVSRVDRVARNLGSLSVLEPIQDRLRSVELGDSEINSFVLSALLAVAKHESDNISARVKASYKAIKTKRPSHKWGSKSGLRKARKESLKSRLSNADQRFLELWSKISVLGIPTWKDWHPEIRTGYWVDTASKLNTMGVLSPRGKSFSGATLKKQCVRGKERGLISSSRTIPTKYGHLLDQLNELTQDVDTPVAQ